MNVTLSCGDPLHAARSGQAGWSASLGTGDRAVTGMLCTACAHAVVLPSTPSMPAARAEGQFQYGTSGGLAGAATVTFSGGVLTVSDGSGASVALGGSGQVFALSNGVAAVPGTSGKTVSFVAAAAAPSTKVVASLPLSSYGSGVIAAVLGTPDVFVLLCVSGQYVKVPGYL